MDRLMMTMLILFLFTSVSLCVKDIIINIPREKTGYGWQVKRQSSDESSKITVRRHIDRSNIHFFFLLISLSSLMSMGWSNSHFLACRLVILWEGEARTWWWWRTWSKKKGKVGWLLKLDEFSVWWGSGSEEGLWKRIMSTY